MHIYLTFKLITFPPKTNKKKLEICCNRIHCHCRRLHFLHVIFHLCNCLRPQINAFHNGVWGIFGLETNLIENWKFYSISVGLMGERHWWWWRWRWTTRPMAIRRNHLSHGSCAEHTIQSIFDFFSFFAPPHQLAIYFMRFPAVVRHNFAATTAAFNNVDLCFEYICCDAVLLFCSYLIAWSCQFGLSIHKISGKTTLATSNR